MTTASDRPRERFIHRSRASLLVLTCTMLCACGSTGEGGGLVLPRDLEQEEAAQRERDELLARVQDELAAAREHLFQTRYESAARIGSRVGDDEQVPAGLRLEARRIVYEARAGALRDYHVDARVVGPTGPVTQGDRILTRMILRNRSTERIEIDLTSRLPGMPGWGSATPTPGLANEVVGRSRFQVAIAYEEFALDGTVVSETSQRVFDLERSIRLEPGEEFSWDVPLDSLEFGGRTNYRTFEVEGTLHPAAIRVGGVPHPGPITFRGMKCPVMPVGWDHLADDPVRRIRQAVDEKASPVHVPLAAALVGDDRREEAVGWLLEVLERPVWQPPSAELRIACCVALRILTGESPGPLPRNWLAWSRAR